jgi:L,D-peptidoglycan transpeptidase YkuD (ErfK/YbiS/YcfS/YnhG family)
MPLLRVLIVTRPGERSRGWLLAGQMRFPVALGRAGIKANKFEGDGATPRGVFHPVRVWWRADRVARPRTRLPVRRIHPADAWCEDPADRRYNRPFRRARAFSGEVGTGSPQKMRPQKDQQGEPGGRLWREDHLYDLIVEIDHNTRPRVARRGSAVFIHLARPNFGPTAGCVGLPPTALRALLHGLLRRTRIVIH